MVLMVGVTNFNMPYQSGIYRPTDGDYKAVNCNVMHRVFSYTQKLEPLLAEAMDNVNDSKMKLINRES
jgi:hypothetical protein